MHTLQKLGAPYTHHHIFSHLSPLPLDHKIEIETVQRAVLRGLLKLQRGGAMAWNVEVLWSSDSSGVLSTSFFLRLFNSATDASSLQGWVSWCRKNPQMLEKLRRVSLHLGIPWCRDRQHQFLGIWSIDRQTKEHQSKQTLLCGGESFSTDKQIVSWSINRPSTKATWINMDQWQVGNMFEMACFRGKDVPIDIDISDCPGGSGEGGRSGGFWASWLGGALVVLLHRYDVIPNIKCCQTSCDLRNGRSSCINCTGCGSEPKVPLHRSSPDRRETFMVGSTWIACICWIPFTSAPHVHHCAYANALHVWENTYSHPVCS